MEFCSSFDECLAAGGPAAVFLRDPEGVWRFDEGWTRDAWTRAPGPHEHGWTWLLHRDVQTGFVTLLLATSPTLLTGHPRGDLRACASFDEALAARETHGQPPVCREAW